MIRIEPLLDTRTVITRENEFVNAVIGGTVPKEYIPAVERGVKEGLTAAAWRAIRLWA